MDFRILGPFEVDGQLGELTLGAMKPRAVLAVLLLHPNQPVSAERIALALWGEEPPADATRTVQVYVSRLRKALGDPDAITTTRAGYRLRVRPGELDAERFQRGVEAGRRALEAGAPEQAADLLREALELWRGPPLAGLEFEPFAAAEIARLEEQRLAALEARVEADLGAGRHAALVSELRQLLDEHPTRERFAAHLMLALYRSGRQAEALTVFRDTRRVLVDQAGIEPGPELQRLHRAVLDQDASLEPSPPAGDLPPTLDVETAPPLVGRDADLARLSEHWRAAQNGHGRLVAVCGVDGIGKSRLVAELAGNVHRAGGGVMYLDGRGPPAPLLRALGELRRPARPTLVVLDDADGLPADVEAALGDLIQALGKLSALVLLCARSPDDVGAHDTLVLERLDAAAVRTIATDRGLPSDALLDAGEGVPRRVHQLATRQAQREAARRVDTAAARTAAGRAELSSREAELTGEVIALQTAQDRDAWGGDDETTVRCPFKGLAAFDVADAPYFFGRERLVAELVARLVGASLLGVVGPSGSGKSSVVRAGLLPALADGVLPGSAQWDRLIMRPGEHPLRELASVTTGRNGDHRVLLVIDQFEEVFTACRDEDERRAFVAAITAPDHGERAVMLAIRADHYGHCSAYPELSRLLAAHHVLVSAMRRDELRRAIERPALRAGLRVEPELTDALVADVEHQPGALPMLSTALLELWQRRDGRRLRLITYEATGGVRGSVARHAEEAFAQLAPAQQTVARSVLLRLAAEDAGGSIERRRIALSALDDEVAEVVGVLTDQRLLTIGAGSVELAHEALLREWPRLRGWLEEDAEGRRLHRGLAAAARDWDESGRDAGDLYRGARLATALEWRARHEPDLNRSERVFLDAGRSAEQAARVRRRRGVATAMAVLAVIAAISTTIAVNAIQRERAEQRAADSRSLATRALARLQDNVSLGGLLALEANRREPTVEARSAVLSVLPALAAYRRLGGPLQHRSGLQGVAISPDGRTLASAGDNGTISLWDVAARRRFGRPLSGHTGLVRDVTFSPDGTLLASSGDDATVRLWDVTSRQLLGHPLRHPADTVNSVAFSPSGQTLASAGGDVEWSSLSAAHGSIRLWDVASQQALGRPLVTGSASVPAVQFSRDGRILAAGASDNTVQLWDVATRRRLAQLAGHNGTVLGVAFSHDDRLLASVGDDYALRLWDVRARRQLGAPVQGHTDTATAVAFAPGDRTVATGGNDATVRLWDVASGRLRTVLVADSDEPAQRQAAGRVAGVLGVAFSPQGGILASADEGGAVQLWDVGPGRALSRRLPQQPGWVQGVTFTSGDTLVAAGTNGLLRLWDARRQRPLGRPLTSAGSALGVAASPDGRMLAVGGSGGILRLWDARTRRPLSGPLAGHDRDIKAVAFSPDGDTIATGGHDGTVRLWDPESARPRGSPLDTRAGPVNGVAFGRDGAIMATAGQDGTVRLWDVEKRRALGPPLRGSPGLANAVAFTPDGDVLASAGQDGSVWLWDVDDRRALGPPLQGHTDVVDTVAFSPDGRTLASGGADHTVRLWDVPSRRALGRPLPHESWVSAVAFSPDGRRLAAAGDKGTVRLWDPLLWSDDLDALTRRLCGVIRRNLTRAEWSEFIPDRPYHETCP